jgi:hypothetical protein
MDEVTGKVDLYINPSEEVIETFLCSTAYDFFRKDKEFYKEEDIDENDYVSKEEWKERMEEIVGEDLGSKPFSRLMTKDADSISEKIDKIKPLARYEIGVKAKEDTMIYFFSDRPESNYPRMIPKKLVGEDGNVMFG